MSDLIERQAAIDGILHLMPPNPNLDDGSAEQLNFSAWKCALTCAEASIKMMPSAQPQWIPVTERLPEDIRPVIVTWCNTDPTSYYQYIVGKRFIGVAHYKSGKWYWYSSTTEDFLAEYGRYDGEEFDEAIEVIAWCELPDPWKGEW